MTEICEHCGQKIVKTRFRKPTLDEVTEYCRLRNNGINPESFIDHYESKGWVIGKSPMKSWQAAVRTWERGNNGSAPKSIGGAGGGESARDKRNREAREEEQRILSSRNRQLTGGVNISNPSITQCTGSDNLQGETEYFF